MKKIIMQILAAFIPNRKKRKEFRRKYKPAKIVGKDNKIYVGQKEVFAVPNLEISINGNGNIIRIPENHQVTGSISIKSSESLIDIKSTKKVNIFVSTIFQTGQKLLIDEDTIIHGAHIFLHEKDASVIIGKDCLFSGNITIWATDGHAILDNNTGEILNPITKPIIINDHCWCGSNVFMTKNTYLGKNSIIRGGSVVTKSIPNENVIIAGNPAKIIKENITWKHETVAQLLINRESK